MIKITSNMPSDKVMVNWQLSKYCENSCHYCTSYDYKLTIKKGKNIMSYTDERLTLDDHIAKLLTKTVTNGHILLFGGEPTLHPKGIEYFNQMCHETKDHPDVTIFLVTHGDIDEWKIHAINNHGKREHIISISYHLYQVDFEKWFEKVKMFHEHNTVIVSAIIPRRMAVWDKFERNMRIILDSGIPTEIKSELDNKTNEPDLVGLTRFRDMYFEAEKTRSDFLNSYYLKELYLDEAGRREIVNDIKVLGDIPIVPNRSICNIRQFCITEDILKYSCDEGNNTHITVSTTPEDVLMFTKKNTVVCTKKRCTENRQIPATITVFGATLDDKIYQDFLAIKV